jgi:hypothetical protein
MVGNSFYKDEGVVMSVNGRILNKREMEMERIKEKKRRKEIEERRKNKSSSKAEED